MRTADHNLGPPRGLLDFHQQHLEVLALAVPFVADLVVGAHDASRPVLVLGLVGVQVDEHRRPFFNALDAAADYFALISGVFLKGLFPFRLTQPLHEHLARRLRGDAAGVVRYFLGFGNLGVHLGVGNEFQSLGQQDLRLGVVHFVHHRPQGKNADVARVRVEFHRQVLGPGNAVAAERGGQRHLHLVQDQFLA